MTGEYKTSIPDNAVERITERYPDGEKQDAEYLVNGVIVGHRSFEKSGEIVYEVSLNNGVRHGTEYWWIAPGHLHEALPYVDGREHGTHKQFSFDGQLIGTYTMEHGTGIDLWWSLEEDGTRYLSEVRYMEDGNRHGVEWWLNADQESVSEELHLDNGQQHGIERHWNTKGRLRRGYPRYFVHDVQVNKPQYIRACASDPTLPPFRIEDNDPHRTFPPEIQPYLAETKHCSLTDAG